VKHNVQQLLEGKEINAIYDGYTFMPFWIGHSFASCFAHLHDYEPHTRNHWIPHYGIFSRIYFSRILKTMQGTADKYTSFKKNSGPPHWNYNPRYSPLEHNDYLKQKGLSLADVKFPSAQVAAL
jgi:hypothetical protein